MRWLRRQFKDLLAYWLLPFVCFALPAGPANSLAQFVARRDWLFKTLIENAERNAAMVTTIDDPAAWKTQLRLLRILDAVDVWHGFFSSDRRIERSLVSESFEWPKESSLLLMGTHVGLGALLMRRLASAGYRPRLIYRDLPPGFNRQAPVFHGYLMWRIAYMRKMGDQGGIAVPGGRDVYAEALKEPGAAIVSCIDAPADRPRGTVLRLWGQTLEFDARGLVMAVDQQVRACHFAMYWDGRLGRRVIELSEPRTLDDQAQALADYADHVRRQVEGHSGQWHLWFADHQVLATED